MDVKVINENEDGSVDVDITNMSREEHDFIFNKGFIALLRESIEREKEVGGEG
jgi:hypothetical protein